MKKLILILCLIATGVYAQFPIASLTATNDATQTSSDFDEFFWRCNGFTDYQLTLTVEGIGDISSFYGHFKVSKDAVGSRTNYIVKGTDEVTMGANTMSVSLSHTNIPPNLTIPALNSKTSGSSQHVTK